MGLLVTRLVAYPHVTQGGRDTSTLQPESLVRFDRRDALAHAQTHQAVEEAAEDEEVVVAKQRRRVGDVLRIGLGGKRAAFGRVLPKQIAFYDFQDASGMAVVADVLGKPVAFVLSVSEAAIKSGRWEVIGTAPLEESLDRPVVFFKRGSLYGTDPGLHLYCEGREKPATWEECQGRELLAVWDPEHVEQRLRDHFAGKPNENVDSMRLREEDREDARVTPVDEWWTPPWVAAREVLPRKSSSTKKPSSTKKKPSSKKVPAAKKKTAKKKIAKKKTAKKNRR